MGPVSARLSYLTARKFRIVVETRRNRPRIVGIVVCQFVGTVPNILGLVWPSFRPKSGSKSKISGRILKSVRGPFSSAESGVRFRSWWSIGARRALPTKIAALFWSNGKGGPHSSYALRMGLPATGQFIHYCLRCRGHDVSGRGVRKTVRHHDCQQHLLYIVQ